jgi:hypothetical protein
MSAAALLRGIIASAVGGNFATRRRRGSRAVSRGGRVKCGCATISGTRGRRACCAWYEHCSQRFRTKARLVQLLRQTYLTNPRRTAAHRGGFEKPPVAVAFGSPFMRAIFGISLLLLGLAMLSCRVETIGHGNASVDPSPVRWVRTVDGWERPDSWFIVAARPPRLHPLVVAAGQGLASLLALAAFRRDES